jgi:hypothetical protein
MARDDQDAGGLGSPSEYLPTLAVALLFALVLGATQWADGSPFPPLFATGGLAIGLASGAGARMVLGRERGGYLAAVGLGAVLTLLLLGAALLATAARAGGLSLQGEGVRLLALQTLLALPGAALGSLALQHLRNVAPAADPDLPEDAPADDVDYTTQPEELVCLLTNQVVNPQLDVYVVCHNRFNDGQTCHAVYLKTYVHLLQGQCKRCYQKLRERDIQGFARG